MYAARAFQLPLLALIANFRVAGPLLNAIKEAYEAAIKSYARAFDEAMGQVDYPGADVVSAPPQKKKR